MFKQMKNIDTAFRQMRMFCLLFLAACFCITLFTVYKSYSIVSRSQQKIFVISNGKAIEAYAADRNDNIIVEARDQVRVFHHYFFTLDPDEKVIRSNITMALYLSDESGRQQYDNLKESGYYNNLIAANISQEITVDSVVVDIDKSPYYFRCNATERLVRSTSVTTRSLVTEGYLRNVARSDNNAHGFLIEKWRILSNKDIKTDAR